MAISRPLLFVSFLLLLPFVWQAVKQTLDGFDAAAMVAGQRVLITGASSGIGEEMAYKYAAYGAHVAILARRKPELERVAAKARELGALAVHVIVADVGSEEGCRAALARTLAAFGGELDVLVLNHVVGFWGWWLPDKAAVLATDPAALGATSMEAHPSGGKRVWAGLQTLPDMLAINTVSFANLATLAMPALARSGVAKAHGGQVVVVTSGAGKIGLPKVAPYSATKHALHGFFDSLRVELKAKDIPVSVTITVIGNIDTENNKVNTAGDLIGAMPYARADDTADHIVRAGATRQRETYFPLGQGLHAMAVLRPMLMDTIDTITTKLMT